MLYCMIGATYYHDAFLDFMCQVLTSAVRICFQLDCLGFQLCDDTLLQPISVAILKRYTLFRDSLDISMHLRRTNSISISQ